ncbi:phosphoribosylanthranilate isomerase [Luteimonas granuli]|uniref:N-(5'-phosphoribosyl)anthranilate isomerase n=1 Tax=Luteimonas granuli TaxID=1176533 RepID=A0A518N6U4_9GAMM|nr:phosphoribosylanthranilate isomerase [Luteimonas granuli]QDW67637.1 phosphoribosylanthranilate isomerase [Luteimonas granuli]
MPRTLFRTRIKFCGLTRAGDVRLAGELGVDAVGFVFAHGSPRRVHAREARALREALAPLVDAVAVFRDNTADEVREVVREVKPSLLQFHGDEDDAFCSRFDLPYVKAVAMGAGARVGGAELAAAHPGASAFLFDSHGGGHDGGSGRRFDWSALPTDLERPFLLSGGLAPDNIHDAVAAIQPWGVDVSSGIESSPGRKDGDLMRAFVSEVRRADCRPDHAPAAAHGALR